MRRLAATAAALVALAIGAAPAATQQTAPAPTISPGVLTVALDLPSEGFQVGAVAGSQVVFARGFEVDLARSVARRMGLRATFVNSASFGDVVAPGPKPWDVAFAQVSILSGRRAAIDYTIPYLQVDQGVLLRRGLGPTPRTLAALARLKLCVQATTTGAAVVARTVRPATRARAYADVTALIQALSTGRCDAVVYDAPSLAVLRSEVPRRVGPMAGVIPTAERYGGVTADGSRLTPALNVALRGLLDDGTVTALTTKWLSIDVSALKPLR
jgi:polar amino acid transport system substrate-binding protein